MNAALSCCFSCLGRITLVATMQMLETSTSGSSDFSFLSSLMLTDLLIELSYVVQSEEKLCIKEIFKLKCVQLFFSFTRNSQCEAGLSAFSFSNTHTRTFRRIYTLILCVVKCEYTHLTTQCHSITDQTLRFISFYVGLATVTPGGEQKASVVDMFTDFFVIVFVTVFSVL